MHWQVQSFYTTAIGQVMGIHSGERHTVETLYSTIYYSKYLIELNIDNLHYMLPFELTKDTPYLALSGELWSVFYEYFNRNWSCYKGFLLYKIYSRFSHSYHWCLTDSRTRGMNSLYIEVVHPECSFFKIGKINLKFNVHIVSLNIIYLTKRKDVYC